MSERTAEMQVMEEAPRDGTLIRLWPADSSDYIVGYYSDKWSGWIDYADDYPLIQQDTSFLGWETIERAVRLNTPGRRAQRLNGPRRAKRSAE